MPARLCRRPETVEDVRGLTKGRFGGARQVDAAQQYRTAVPVDKVTAECV